MIFELNEVCDRCGKSLGTCRGPMPDCPNCGAEFCDACAVEMRDQGIAACPVCEIAPDQAPQFGGDAIPAMYL